MAQMAAAGVKQALAVVLSAYGSYSSCRQYREDIARAQKLAGPGAPRVEKVRLFYNHPEFIAANTERVREAMKRFATSDAPSFMVAFTAHSIPLSMAGNCDYEPQLRETSRLVAQECDINPGRFCLVYQSRSGRSTDPWLGPDIVDHLRALKARGIKQVLIHPVGFLSDHVEVLYDLDIEASAEAAALGLEMVRSRTVGTHPRFVGMLAELIAERTRGTHGEAPRRSVGVYGPNPDFCPERCCLGPG
jgi:ferrochelatase